ncbi:MAG: alpha/beta hydrolase [Bacteroidota bacterium]
MKISTILYLLGALALLYLLFCLLLYVYQDRFIFFPVILPDDYAFSEFEEVEELYLQAADGVRLHALHFQLEASKGTVLYFHGNSRAVDDWGGVAEDFRALGYEVLMPDYRGFGKSQGKRSEKTLRRDALAWYDCLRGAEEAERIILYGRSLGSGVACQLATKVDCRLLVLETPYTSIGAMARLRFPLVPSGYLLKFRFQNYRNIRKIKCPVHIFHGTEDELIPYHMAVRLADILGREEVLTTVVGGTHNNLADYPLYHRTLAALLSEERG